jgi:hypothetical protein
MVRCLSALSLPAPCPHAIPSASMEALLLPKALHPMPSRVRHAGAWRRAPMCANSARAPLACRRFGPQPLCPCNMRACARVVDGRSLYSEAAYAPARPDDAPDVTAPPCSHAKGRLSARRSPLLLLFSLLLSPPMCPHVIPSASMEPLLPTASPPYTPARVRHAGAWRRAARLCCASCGLPAWLRKAPFCPRASCCVCADGFPERRKRPRASKTLAC